jgi:hypothetical protein
MSPSSTRTRLEDAHSSRSVAGSMCSDCREHITLVSKRVLGYKSQLECCCAERFVTAID